MTGAGEGREQRGMDERTEDPEKPPETVTIDVGLDSAPWAHPIATAHRPAAVGAGRSCYDGRLGIGGRPGGDRQLWRGRRITVSLPPSTARQTPFVDPD